MRPNSDQKSKTLKPNINISKISGLITGSYERSGLIVKKARIFGDSYCQVTGRKTRFVRPNTDNLNTNGLEVFRAKSRLNTVRISQCSV